MKLMDETSSTESLKIAQKHMKQKERKNVIQTQASLTFCQQLKNNMHSTNKQEDPIDKTQFGNQLEGGRNTILSRIEDKKQYINSFYTKSNLRNKMNNKNERASYQVSKKPTAPQNYTEKVHSDPSISHNYDNGDKLYSHNNFGNPPVDKYHDYIKLYYENFDDFSNVSPKDSIIKQSEIPYVNEFSHKSDSIYPKISSDFGYEFSTRTHSNNSIYSLETKSMEVTLGILKLKRIFKDRTYYEQGYKYKSDLQIRVLNEVLGITPYPGAQARDTLAILLNLNPRSIQIWFQNARQSCEKKLTKDELRSRKINNHVDVLMLVEIYQKNFNKY